MILWPLGRPRSLQRGELAQPIFSDDRFVRLGARGDGVPAFGTRALLTALHGRGVISDDELAETRAMLLRRGAWGLDPSADELEYAAAADGWEPIGGWVYALCDPSAGVNGLMTSFGSASPSYSVSTPRIQSGWLFGLRESSWCAKECLEEVPSSRARRRARRSSGGRAQPRLLDLGERRKFTFALLDALRSVPRRLAITDFGALVTLTADLALAKTPPHLRGETLKWIQQQVPLADGIRLIDLD